MTIETSEGGGSCQICSCRCFHGVYCSCYSMCECGHSSSSHSI